MAKLQIDLDININKSLEGAFNKLVKETEKKLGGISKQAKSASDSLNDLFSGSKAKADAFIASLSKVEGVEGINTIIESFKGLKQALTDGSITTETYYAEISKLTDQFAKLSIQADVAGKKVTGVGGLDQKTIGNIKGGVITKTDIQNLDVPQLQQSLVILENQVQTERLKGKALRENRDVQEMIKKQLKDMNLSTQQKLIQDQKALDIANKQLAAQRKANAQEQLTYARGLGSSSISDMKTKVQELTIARDKLNGTTAAEQKEVRAVNKEIQELTKRYKQLETAGTDLAKKNDKTSDTFRKLGTMAATYFSVYAVKNFVKEIAMVTGEFDIQRRSLAALIQNKAAADEIFERIKQTALRSPFSVMELTTYTKQLAAYRVETENLYDTTYRLADVSAGLGVDMGRLILAFGQVRAASVLRGCLGIDTQIVMFNNSHKKVQDIVVGDEILGDDGTKRNVLELISGKEQMYKVIAKNCDAETYRVNEYHILTLFDKIDNVIKDVYVLDYLKETERYLGAIYDSILGYKTYEIYIEKDIIDDYFGFVIDGNKRFIIESGILTHNTELRQFTEAGIPLIQLLADKFTELEKRTVSTGEVFDKISNRLVPFKMIDEIFKDMTKSGGAFYEMQKIQSETIKGRLVNLTDAYQIMLDKIGSGGTGNFLLKGIISVIETLLKNFDSLAAAIITTGSAIAVFKTVAFFATVELNALSKAQSLAKAVSLAFTGVLKLQKNATIAASAANIGLTGSFAKLIAANPYAAVIAGVVALGVAIYSLVRAQGAFNRELSKMDRVGAAEFDKLSGKWKELTSIIKDGTKSVSQQNSALDELKQTFKDILPLQKLTIDNIKQEKIAYDDVRNAIYQKISAQVKEQKATKILESFGKDVEKFRTVFIESFTEDKKGLAGAFLADFENLLEGVTSLGLTKTQKFNENVQKLTEKYGISINGVGDKLRLFKESVVDLNKEIANITVNVGDGSSYQKYGVELADKYKFIQDQILKIRENFKNSWANSKGEISFDKEQKLIEEQVAYIRASIENLKSDTSLYSIKLQEDLQKQIDKLLGSGNRHDMVTAFRTIAKNVGLSINDINQYLRSDEQSFEEWSKTVNDSYNEIIRKVKQYETSNSEVAKNALFSSKAEFDRYKKEAEFLNKIINLYNIREDKTKGGGSTEDPKLKAIKEEISLIETLTKRYEDLRKAGATDSDAKQTTAKEYAQNIKNVQAILNKQGIQFDFESMIGDKDALTKALQAQIDRFANNPSVQKELSEAFGKIGIDVKINNLESIQREINEELEKLKQRRSISLEINQAPSSVRPVLMSLFGIEEKDMLTEIGSLMDAANSILVKGLTDANINSDIKDFATITKEQFFEILAPLTDGKGFSAIGKELLSVFEFIQSENQNYIKQSVSAYGELLKKYADFNDQLIEVAYNKDNELKKLDEMYVLSKKQIEEDLMNSSIKDEETYYKKLKQNLENYYKFKLAILNKEKKETARIRYEELKESDAYINMFDRVGIMSEGNMIESYNKVRQGIVDAFSSGTIKLKEFKSALAELDNQFQAFYQQTGKIGAYLQGGIEGLFKNISETAYNLQAIASEIEKMEDTQDPVKFMSTLGKDKVDYLQKQGINISELFTSTKGSTAAMSANIGTAAKGMSAVAAKGAGAAMWVQLIVQNIYGAIKGLKEMRDLWQEYRESRGDIVDDITTENDKRWEVLDNFNETAMKGFEQLKSGNILGALITTISSYIAIFKDINQIGDRQIQEQIDKNIESTDKLKLSVDRLNDAVDEQMGSEWIQNMQKIADIQNQIAANAQANIAAQNSMKNPDEDLLEQYEQDLYDAEKAAIDATNAIVEELMGGNIKDMAEELGDIFVSAFMRGEDAIEEMKETFNKMIQNMIVKSIVSTIIGKRLEAITKQLTASIDNDGVLSEDEILGLAGLSEEVLAGLGTDLEAIKPFLERIREILGIGGALGETLQKGIKGITEQTASAIESYLNTLRYEVFKHTNLLTSIARDVALSRDIQSSILIQAQQHYQISLGIKQLIESVTMNNGSGVGFRTYSY